MKNTVRTYNMLTGKLLYERNFIKDADAYKEYLDIIGNAKKTLPNGFGITVVRLKDDKVMTIKTIIK